MNKEIKFEIPEGTEPSRCKSQRCKALIYWIKPKGKNMPVNPDGTCHFATCVDAEKFRRYKPEEDPRRPEQVQQFSELMQISHRLPTRDQNFLRSVAPKFSNRRELTKWEANALDALMEHHR